MSVNATASKLSHHVIGEILAQMGRQRMNKAELSRRLGVTEVWVGRRLNGVIPLHIDDLDRIAGVLDVPVGQLMPDTRTTVVYSPGERVIAQVGAERSHQPGRAVRRTKPLGGALQPAGSTYKV